MTWFESEACSTSASHSPIRPRAVLFHQQKSSHIKRIKTNHTEIGASNNGHQGNNKNQQQQSIPLSEAYACVCFSRNNSSNNKQSNQLLLLLRFAINTSRSPHRRERMNRGNGEE
ncbi:hypothetical protein CEXT_230071 [Caerostris extrusa]|uniref:Uncharacterized protein n=1 Tax=Caerostris extrusa TaxID=172846 RepID=A0AAV4UIX9_CAEEX|nr:hypothetical protein CEXT_230071 [Caerostris extrusa]